MIKDKLSDQWQTPDDLFNVLDKGGFYQGIEFKGFNFDIDLCAEDNNTKCELYFNREENYLAFCDAELEHRTCAFMNPPYSNPKPFIEKAWEDSKYCKIVLLVKCDPSTKWWATFWNYKDKVYCWSCNNEYCENSIKEEKCQKCLGTSINIFHKGPKPGCDYLFFPKRIKFDPPQELIDSGEVWDIGKRYNCRFCTGNEVIETSNGYYCNRCSGSTHNLNPLTLSIKSKNKWVQKCKDCDGEGKRDLYSLPDGKFHIKWKVPNQEFSCHKCKGKGYTPLSGPAFSCALLIFDRRNT